MDLKPGERRSIRFALAWDLPVVEFGAGRRWYKRYTRDWGRTGTRAFDLATHALEQAPAWRAAIETWQRPVLASADRPDWYKAALFNELYFLVDGGTFWEAGEVDGPEPDRDDPGRFALLECLDYPFYDSVDVDFYASFAILRLFPELEARGIRDLLAADRGRRPGDRRRSRRRASGRRARSVAPCRMTSVVRTMTRSTARTATTTRTSTTGRTSARSSCSRSGATRWPPVPTATPSSATRGRPWRPC